MGMKSKFNKGDQVQVAYSGLSINGRTAIIINVDEFEPGVFIYNTSISDLGFYENQLRLITPAKKSRFDIGDYVRVLYSNPPTQLLAGKEGRITQVFSHNPFSYVTDLSSTILREDQLTTATPLAETKAYNTDPSGYAAVVNWFSDKMYMELIANDDKGGRTGPDGWLTVGSDKYFINELYYHVGKLQEAQRQNDVELIREYTADVANIAMMISDRTRHLV